jgi:hypothetical protein
VERRPRRLSDTTRRAIEAAHPSPVGDVPASPQPHPESPSPRELDAPAPPLPLAPPPAVLEVAPVLVALLEVAFVLVALLVGWLSPPRPHTSPRRSVLSPPLPMTCARAPLPPNARPMSSPRAPVLSCGWWPDPVTIPGLAGFELALAEAPEALQQLRSRRSRAGCFDLVRVLPVLLSRRRRSSAAPA